MSNPHSQLAADVTAKTVEAVQQAQTASLRAGFELAGKLLEQQRAYTLGIVDAFAQAATPKKA